MTEPRRDPGQEAIAVKNEVMQHGESIWQPDRTLTKDALVKRATVCEKFYEDCLSQHADWGWAIQGAWYSKHFRKCLGASPLNVSRCMRLGRMAQRRFRCSHPAALALLGKDLVEWVDREFGGADGAA
jgi:hypothetical protein